jgi:hypothetical protein
MKYSIYKFFIGVFIVLFPLISIARSSQIYEYQSYGQSIRPTEKIGIVDTSDDLSIDIKKGVLYVGHAGRGLKYCEPQKEYYCFFSPTLSFAIPRKRIFNGDSWKVKNLTFNVAGQERIRLIGMNIDVYVIVSKINEDRTEQFYYSEKYGLLAFSVFHPGESSQALHILTGRFGFPK